MDDSDPHVDAALDEALEETFPASDPPANTVETGIRAGAPSSSLPSEARSANAWRVTDNPTLNRFELSVDGHTAFLVYQRTPQTLTIVHTEVPEALRGRKIGDALVKAAIDAGHAESLRIVAVCPFARAYLRRQGPNA
jgi:predicted GNAT family acetyltransferase